MSKYSVGLDFGTTSVSIAVLNGTTKKTIFVDSKTHRGAIHSDNPLVKEQDPDVLFDLARKMLDSVLANFFPIGSIGITGQMHGILYLDSERRPVSPLYTWQDSRAAQLHENGLSYAQEVAEKTGYPAFPGYGLITHYFLKENGLVPDNAEKLCTVMDYAAMRLSDSDRIVIHPTNAASLGLYDINKGKFDPDALVAAGIDPKFLPEVAADPIILGAYRDVPLYQGIGDNQASVLYSLVDYPDGVLVNVGTGSQVSRITDSPDAAPSLEVRPFIDGKYLIVGSALCGGRAYALLEKFFRDYVRDATGKEEEQYDTLNSLAREALDSGMDIPKVDTSFSGTRQDPSKTGAIYGLTEFNFTPAAFVLGLLQGIVDELHELYGLFPVPCSTVVASGNGVRRNRVLQTLIDRTFGLPFILLNSQEEAAAGAALFALLARQEPDND